MTTYNTSKVERAHKQEGVCRLVASVELPPEQGGQLRKGYVCPLGDSPLELGAPFQTGVELSGWSLVMRC